MGEKQSSDWVNTFVNHSPTETRHSLNATGGTKNINYFVNLGYAKQGGRWITDAADYQRFNLRSNVTAELTKGLKARVLLNLMKDIRNEQSTASWRIFEASWDLYPIDPIYLPDPQTGEASTEYPYNVPASHPGTTTNQNISGYNHYTQRLAQTNLQLEWEAPFAKGLKLMGMYSYDFTDDDFKKFRKRYFLYNIDYRQMSQGTPNIEYSDLKKENTLLQAQISYTKTLFDKHNINAMFLYEESARHYNNFFANKKVVIGSVEHLYAGDPNETIADQVRTDPSKMTDWVNKGLVGRVNYNYQSKYIAEFLFRLDASSNFPPNSRWGFFPSTSVAWRISEEKFVKENPALGFINNLKLRASYGVMGDDTAAQWQYLTGYQYPYSSGWEGHGQYIVDGDVIPGIDAMGLPNTKITWFTARSSNIGIEADFWKGLFGITAEVFQRDRDGLMGKGLVDLPNEVGMSLPDENLEGDRTVGLELTLTHRQKIRDFRYNVSTFVAMDRLKYTKLVHVLPTSSYNNWRNVMDNRWGKLQSNQPARNNPGLNMFWGVDYTGQYRSFDEIFASGIIYDGAGNSRMLPGDLIYEDYNKDGVIDDLDKHPIGIDHPAMSYGLTFGGDWRGFDLNFTVQGTAMNRKKLEGKFITPIGNDVSGLQVFTDRWHRADPFSADNGPSDGSAWIPGFYPSVYSGNTKRNFIMDPLSQFWLLSSDYLRLKTVELGYTIPAKITRKAGIDQARFFLNGYNLLTFTTMRLQDPEQSGRYPLNKSFNMGVNITF
jgi:TonB-linked SusC/RagA family outer membrane protein